jgi:hypothetical protein
MRPTDRDIALMFNHCMTVEDNIQHGPHHCWEPGQPQIPGDDTGKLTPRLVRLPDVPYEAMWIAG